jgi:hypothetical protein
MKTDWLLFAQFVFTFGVSAWVFLKAVQEFFKSQTEKVRLKSIDIDALKTLMRSKEKFEQDIEDLKMSDHIQKEDLKRIEADFKDIIKKFMEYQFKNFGDHQK